MTIEELQQLILELTKERDDLLQAKADLETKVETATSDMDKLREHNQKLWLQVQQPITDPKGSLEPTEETITLDEYLETI